MLEMKKRDDGTRVETYRTPLGLEYQLELAQGETSRATFSELGRLGGLAGGKKGGAIGGRSKSEKKLSALAQNRQNSDGRTPTTPAGLARLPLRKALETIFGKPLPKTDAPIRFLMSPMSSARVVRRAWEELQDRAPEDRRAEIAALVENLARTIDENPRPKHEAENVGEVVPIPDDGKPKTNLSPDEWFRRRHANDDPETVARLAEDLHASAARSPASWQRPHHPQPPPQ